jgi:hypothetical protein
MCLDWLRKRLGYHVCEEFTRWETFEGKFARVPRDIEESILAGGAERIEFTRRWQERECTICGKLQQRDLSQ